MNDRERDVRWISAELEVWVANLGYPVGMGVVPHPVQTERFAEGLFDALAKRHKLGDEE